MLLSLYSERQWRFSNLLKIRASKCQHLDPKPESLASRLRLLARWHHTPGPIPSHLPPDGPSSPSFALSPASLHPGPASVHTLPTLTNSQCPESAALFVNASAQAISFHVVH